MVDQQVSLLIRELPIQVLFLCMTVSSYKRVCLLIVVAFPLIRLIIGELFFYVISFTR